MAFTSSFSDNCISRTLTSLLNKRGTIETLTGIQYLAQGYEVRNSLIILRSVMCSLHSNHSDRETVSGCPLGTQRREASHRRHTVRPGKPQKQAGSRLSSRPPHLRRRAALLCSDLHCTALLVRGYSIPGLGYEYA
jgi:hypothetical protein